MSNNALWIILQRLRTPLLVIIVTYSISILGMVLIPGLDDKGAEYHLSFFDAFYFISYTASTIGFGETPYEFTYEQRLWVLVCIYLTVVGWFYGLGALVSVVSDKTLKFEIMRGRFRKQVQSIKGDFIIVLGYSYVNIEVIQKLLESGIKVVLIDENEDNINHFMLEDFSRSVPVMVGNALITETLEDAGIRKENCKAIISLFSKEEKNLRISVLTKFLNSNVKVVAKSTLYETTTSILDTDIAKVQNPFDIFAKRLDIALTSPHILILENWIYENADLSDKALFLPRGKYIICGYGRFGQALQSKFEKHGIDYVFIDENRMAKREMIENEQFLRANADDKEILCEAGIREASCIIAGTQNDIDNISIMITAKKLNPDIYLIARENTMKEVSIFQAASIDWLFMIERILINKTAMFLANPLKHRFLKAIIYKDEIWAKSLVKMLHSQLGSKPILMSLKINEQEAFALSRELKSGTEVKIDVLLRSLHNREISNGAVPLLIHRNDEEILLPADTILESNDHILFACDEESKEEIELIASNIYELHYAQYGKEKQSWILEKLFGRLL
ncbi:MAG: NAD-binding protein [Epsilonproteobacteria bacterium]|nr:NAD-binding protein [Campylobacterota bacterium]